MGDSLCRLMHGVSFLPNTTDQARANVREMKALGVDAIKVIYLDQAHTGNASVPVMRSELMQAIIDEAHSLGLKTYGHAPTLAHAKEVLRAGADVLAHSVADAAVDDEFIGLMRMCRDHFRISEKSWTGTGSRSVNLPLGTRMSFMISEQNSCDENATGGVTRNVFAGEW